MPYKGEQCDVQPHSFIVISSQDIIYQILLAHCLFEVTNIRVNCNSVGSDKYM